MKIYLILLLFSLTVLAGCDKDIIPEDECNENPQNVSCDMGIIYELDTFSNFVVGNVNNNYRCYFNLNDHLIQVFRDGNTIESALTCYLPPDKVVFNQIDFCQYSILNGILALPSSKSYIASIDFSGECPDFFLKFTIREMPGVIGQEGGYEQFLYLLPVLPDSFTIHFMQEAFDDDGSLLETFVFADTIRT